MKPILFIIISLTILTNCNPKQLKSNLNGAHHDSQFSINENDKPETNTSNKPLANNHKDTFILGIPYSRIDSIKINGKNNGGQPESDLNIAKFLKLSDSVRIIGSHSLRFNGRSFAMQEYNKKHLNQLDLEIIEEREGIVSVKKRFSNKPDYFPLLNQQIEFYNCQNQIINSFDINKNNPFRLDKSKKIKEFVYPPPNNKSEWLANQKGNWEEQVVKYYSYNYFNVQQNGFVIVEYQLYAMDAHEGILKSISTLMVLDSMGNEYCRINDLHNKLHSYWMVSGGRYLMMNGGGILGEGFQRLENSFLKIVEVKTKKKIYEEGLENADDDFSEFFESETPIKISLSYGSYKKTKEKQFTALIFDLNSKTRCTKIFSQTDLLKITNEGIKYSGNEWLQKFKFDCKTF